MKVAMITRERAHAHVYSRPYSGAPIKCEQTFEAGALVLVEESERRHYTAWALVGESQFALFWPHEFEVLGDL